MPIQAKHTTTGEEHFLPLAEVGKIAVYSSSEVMMKKLKRR